MQPVSDYLTLDRGGEPKLHRLAWMGIASPPDPTSQFRCKELFQQAGNLLPRVMMPCHQSRSRGTEYIRTRRTKSGVSATTSNEVQGSIAASAGPVYSIRYSGGYSQLKSRSWH